jgi:hypothetical protein
LEFLRVSPLLKLHTDFAQNVLTSKNKKLIVKIALMIIRRLSKQHYSQKQKSYKNKHQKTKNSDSSVAILKHEKRHSIN